MTEKTTYYVLKEKAVPEVLLKVVRAKNLLDLGRCNSIQEATATIGISRSSFYKYKDDIFKFHENNRGRTITLMISLEDAPGLLSSVIHIVAEYHANILTLHQSIPVNNMASITLSVEVLPETLDLSDMINTIEKTEGIGYVKILARE